MKKLAIILNILFILIGLFGLLLALTAPMIFDAPGSENNNYVWILFWSALALPFTSFGAVITSMICIFKLNNYKKALRMLIIPFLNVAIIAASLTLIQIYCAGNFSCH